MKANYAPILCIVALGFADLLTTVYAIQQLNMTEANPLMAALMVDSMTPFILVKGGMTLGIGCLFLALQWVSQNTPTMNLSRTIAIVFVGLNAAQAVVVANNVMLIALAISGNTISWR
jgi:hypothetical protein